MIFCWNPADPFKNGQARPEMPARVPQEKRQPGLEYSLTNWPLAAEEGTLSKVNLRVTHIMICSSRMHEKLGETRGAGAVLLLAPELSGHGPADAVAPSPGCVRCPIGDCYKCVCVCQQGWRKQMVALLRNHRAHRASECVCESSYCGPGLATFRTSHDRAAKACGARCAAWLTEGRT